MATFSRMPRYDIRNDGAGPYAVFYCDTCDREFRSQPDLANAVATDLGRSALGGLLRRVPLVGSSVADNVVGEDPRYSYKMNAGQLESAWKQVQQHFRECPTCGKVVCLSDFDAQTGFCNEDSPRTSEIAESRGAQAGAAIKGFADAFGFGSMLEKAEEAALRAEESLASCPSCATKAAPGTKFCPECGTKMTQPASDACPNCGTAANGAKFCPNCGTRIERAPAVPKCPNCGAETQGARFCPECGTKIAAS